MKYCSMLLALLVSLTLCGCTANGGKTSFLASTTVPANATVSSTSSDTLQPTGNTLTDFQFILHSKDIERYPSKYKCRNVIFTGYAGIASTTEITVTDDPKVKDDGTFANQLKLANETLLVKYSPEPIVLAGDHIQITGILTVELVNGTVVKNIKATKIKIL